MFHTLLNEIKQQRMVLLSGIDLEQHIQLPGTITDEVNNTSPGFYFGDIEANGLKGYKDLTLILDDPQLRPKYLTVAPNGDLVPDRVKCLEFLHKMESIQSVLGTLIFICSGSPYHGTEFTTTCIRNLPGGNIRNAKFISGSLVLVSGYNKNSFSVQSQLLSCLLVC